MNQREPTAVPYGAGRALPCLALLLLPILTETCASARAQGSWGNAGLGSKPYLAVIGAPALRFAEATPPPDIAGRPAGAAPPHPSSMQEPSASAPPASSPVPSAPPAPIEPTPPAPAANAPKPSTESANAAAPIIRTPPPILPDEVHPQARPEDFLPFFQIPSVRPGDTNVVPVPPTPGTLPPSSATYTQTPQ